MSFYGVGYWGSSGVPDHGQVHDPPQDYGDGVDSGSRDHDSGSVQGREQHTSGDREGKGYDTAHEGSFQRSEWHGWGRSDAWQDHSWGNRHWDRSGKQDDNNQGWNSWHRKSSQSDTWGSASTGSQSKEPQPPDSNPAGHPRDQGVPDDWRPREVPGVLGPRGDVPEGRGPSEKMIVPSFSGIAEGDGEDIGASARSYVRQVAAWQRMTRLSSDKQALVLYQNLSGKAWVDAERLDVDRLASHDGVAYFLGWIRERYLDVQVTQVGRALSDFFRKLRRKSGQSIRDYLSDFDRAHARLTECGCLLPDLAAAWVFVDRMELEEGAELNLLASVGNQYQLRQLQQAAIVQDRGLRKPWENSNRTERPPKREWWGKKSFQTAHMADYEGSDGDLPVDGELDSEEAVPESVAEELYEAFMTHESAKQKYRDTVRLRGSDPDALKQVAADRLQAAKARSFCAGCKRRGHWHKDPCCPLNQNKNQSQGSSTSSWRHCL